MGELWAGSVLVVCIDRWWGLEHDLLETVKFPVYTVYKISIRDAFSLYSTCLEFCLMCLIVQPNVVITGHLSQIWITLTYIQVFELSRAVVNDMGFVKYSVEHVQVWLFLSPCSVYYRDSYRKWVWLPDDVMDLEDSILTALSGHLNTSVPVL